MRPNACVALREAQNVIRQVMPQSHSFETKMFLGSATSQSVTYGRPNLGPKKVFETSSGKRKRMTLDVSQSGNQIKLKSMRLPMTEQDVPAAECRDDRIRLLEDENQALKIENKALRKEVLKKHACLICERSYNRSDGLYKHLREGDDEHKRLAQERYECPGY